MPKLSLLILASSLIAAAILYDRNAWYAMVCLGVFGVTLFDAKTR